MDGNRRKLPVTRSTGASPAVAQKKAATYLAFSHDSTGAGPMVVGRARASVTVPKISRRERGRPAGPGEATRLPWTKTRLIGGVSCQPAGCGAGLLSDLGKQDARAPGRIRHCPLAHFEAPNPKLDSKLTKTRTLAA